MLNIQDYGSGGGGSIETPVAIADGGTGATTAEDARDNLGIVAGSTDLMKLAPLTFQATSTGTQGVGLTMGNNGTQTDGTDATSHYRKYVSTATTGQSAGWGPSAGGAIPRITSAVYLVFKTGPSLDASRIYVGLVTQALSAVARGSDELGAAGVQVPAAMLRYSTAVDGTAVWRFVTSDAVLQVATDTSVPIAINTRYEVKIVPTTGSIACYINGVLAATNTSGLPSDSAILAPMITATTLEDVAKEMHCARIAIEPLN